MTSMAESNASCVIRARIQYGRVDVVWRSIQWPSMDMRPCGYAWLALPAEIQPSSFADGRLAFVFQKNVISHWSRMFSVESTRIFVSNVARHSPPPIYAAYLTRPANSWMVNVCDSVNLLAVSAWSSGSVGTWQAEKTHIRHKKERKFPMMIPLRLACKNCCGFE